MWSEVGGRGRGRESPVQFQAEEILDMNSKKTREDEDEEGKVDSSAKS